VGGKGGGGGRGGEMTQALYAHMNNKIIKKKEKEKDSQFQTSFWAGRATLHLNSFRVLHTHCSAFCLNIINSPMRHPCSLISVL
jgi:hypothetical protein